MARGGLRKWDKRNKDQQTIVCLTPTYRDLLAEKTPDLVKVIMLFGLWAFLKKDGVLDARTEQRLKDVATNEDPVEKLLDHISRGPLWWFHSLMRALHLNNQDHVITLIGLDPDDYQDDPHRQKKEEEANSPISDNQTCKSASQDNSSENDAVNLAGITRVWQDLCSKLPYLPVDVKKPLLEEMRQALHLDTVTKDGVSRTPEIKDGLSQHPAVETDFIKSEDGGSSSKNQLPKSSSLKRPREERRTPTRKSARLSTSSSPVDS